VKRGDTIALVGSTGYAIAPHVHYEVHENGDPVDPLKYIFPDAIAD
jgi:murein DD-endopeptidase MepM/ murein hydrolase activator NlpD